MNDGTDETEPLQTREFDVEARERLARMEAHHENLDEKVEGLSEGQTEIMEALNTLDSEYVEDERLEPLADEVEKNVEARQKGEAMMRYTLAILTLLGGFSGVILVIL
jgi:predicted nuclease with TOPRIM domain